jgi:hypothetical protein
MSSTGECETMNDLNPSDSTVQDERRPIPGYEGLYEIDRRGNVYAMFGFRQWKPGRLNKTRISPEGYVTTVLQKEGKGKTRTIHRLLMLAWQPVENSHQLEVNHIDGDKTNNDLSNLEWVTHHENMLHMFRILKTWEKNQVRGVTHGRAKLTEDNVREIRRLFAGGKARKELAAQFGVSTTNITFIVTRKLWPHIE